MAIEDILKQLDGTLSRLTAAVNSLANCTGDDPDMGTVVTEPPKKIRKRKEAPIEVSSAVTVAQPVSTTVPGLEELPAKEQTGAAPVPDVLTEDDVRDAARKFMVHAQSKLDEKEALKAAQKIIAEFGAKKINELKPAQYAAAINRFLEEAGDEANSGL